MWRWRHLVTAAILAGAGALMLSATPARAAILLDEFETGIGTAVLGPIPSAIAQVLSGPAAPAMSRPLTRAEPPIGPGGGGAGACHPLSGTLQVLCAAHAREWSDPRRGLYALAYDTSDISTLLVDLLASSSGPRRPGSLQDPSCSVHGTDLRAFLTIGGQTTLLIYATSAFEALDTLGSIVHGALRVQTRPGDGACRDEGLIAWRPTGIEEIDWQVFDGGGRFTGSDNLIFRASGTSPANDTDARLAVMPLPGALSFAALGALFLGWFRRVRRSGYSTSKMSIDATSPESPVT